MLRETDTTGTMSSFLRGHESSFFLEWLCLPIADALL